MADMPRALPGAPALSAPVARRPLHTRQIECRGFERDDGLFDIEARMTDVKSYAFDNRFRGEVRAGEPVHDMWLRLTVDERLTIVAAEAVTAASPYAVCPAVNERYARLAGLRIGPGWRGEVKRRLGGVHGCTHLTELLGPLATTAFQTVYTRSRQKRSDGAAAATPKRRPAILDTCHAYASDGDVVREFFPDFYTGPKPDEPA